MSDRRKRFNHAMRLNDSTETVHAAVWFDTETDQIPDGPHAVTQVLRFGFAAYRRRLKNGAWSNPDWCRFTTPEQFIAFVEAHARPKTKTYLFCHNTNFDVTVLGLIPRLQAGGWELRKAIIEGPPTALTWRRGNVTLVGLDTLNFWRMPLTMIGAMVGMPKLPFPKESEPREVWDTYCKRDVEVIMAACLQWWGFLVTHDLGGFAMTMAGQSLRSFRHRFMSHPIYIHTHARTLDIARQAYVGGRVECFYIGHWKRKVWALDINSMYPYVMRNNEYPTGRKTSYSSPSLETLSRKLGQYGVIADCTITIDAPVFPMRLGDKLYFPTGSFRTCLTTPELSYALDHHYIGAVHYMTTFTMAPLFECYVDYYYQMRLKAKANGDETRSQLFKLLLNSLYGKFGQRGFVYEGDHVTTDTRIHNYMDYDLDTGETRKVRQFGGLVQVFQNEGESRDSMPSIAAHVTAYARMHLWSLMQQAGMEHILYCDTDCLWVDSTGYKALKPLIHPTELGRLKVEHAESECLIRGPKDYVIGDTAKTKGARKNGKWVAPNVIEQERWDSLTGLLRKGRLDNPQTHIVRKRFARVYRKGLVCPSGRVLPFDASALLGASATPPAPAP